MTEYKRCPTCGAICNRDGDPDWCESDAYAYEPACDALVRRLAVARMTDRGSQVFMWWKSKAREIVEASDD